MIDAIDLPAATPDENPALVLAWVPPLTTGDGMEPYLQPSQGRRGDDLSPAGRRLAEVIRDQAIDAHSGTQPLTDRMDVPVWVYDVQRSLGKIAVLASGLLDGGTPGYAYEALTGLLEEVRVAVDAPANEVPV